MPLTDTILAAMTEETEDAYMSRVFKQGYGQIRQVRWGTALAVQEMWIHHAVSPFENAQKAEEELRGWRYQYGFFY
jgi:hypothetical protein